MAFVPSQNLLCDLLKAFGLEGRKVDGLVLEVRVNDTARLYVSEIIDDSATPLDDIVGCLHRLTVERAEVDGRGCVTPVLHKPMLTPKEQESLRAACQGTAEPHWVPRKEISHSYTSFSPIERIVMEDGGIEVVDSTRRNPPTPEELEGRPIEQFREWRQAIREWRQANGFVEHVAGPDGNPDEPLQGSLPERDGWFTPQGLDMLRGHLADGNTVTFANHAVKIETPDPDEPTVIG